MLPRSMLVAFCLLAVLMVNMRVSAGEEPPKFATKPTAAKAGDKVKVEFALDRETDVEVAVLGAAGKVVRHLAAGVLGGEKPPPEPLKAGLSQTIEWDGKDDAAKPAGGGPFKVRVRAGTGAKFGKVIGFDPYRFSDISGLATDEKGLLYVLAMTSFRSPTIRVFGPDGKYLRTAWPPPANLRAEDLKGLPQLTGPATDPDYRYPGNYHSLYPILFPAPRLCVLSHRVAGNEMLLFGRDYAEVPLFQIGTDGSVSDNFVLGKLVSGAHKISGHKAVKGPIEGVFSPDGLTLYVAGIHSKATNPNKGTNTDFWKSGRIHSVNPKAPSDPKPFADVEIPAGAKLPEIGDDEPFVADVPWPRLSAVHGLDVDRQGNVYACDRVNNCIAVFDPAGKPLGKVAVKDPDNVAVHAKTGAIYVLTRGEAKNRRCPVGLVKLSGYKDGKEVARLNFDQPSPTTPFMALDEASDPPAVWVANVGAGNSLARFVDQGASFKEASKAEASRSPDGLDIACYCWVNPVTDEVFVNDGWGRDKSGFRRYDGKTGKRLPCDFNALDMAFDLDGNVYYSGYQAYTTPVWRLTPDLKPLTFPGSRDNKTTGKDIYGKYGVGNSQKGLYVGRDGSIYSFFLKQWQQDAVYKWSADGKGTDFITGTFCDNGQNSGCLKVDAAGNLYIGVTGFPKTYTLPYSGPGTQLTGSVVKLKASAETCAPADQTPRPASAVDWRAGPGVRFYPWINGVLDIFPYQAPNAEGGCTCKEARFDLDLYGRLYIPNVLTYRITMLDNAGNVILKAGHYGNADSEGPGETSPVKKPEIPLGWPMTVGAAPDHDHLYAGDVVNSRIVRIDLTHAAEAACDVK